jgi:hypothetical protein
MDIREMKSCWSMRRSIICTNRPIVRMIKSRRMKWVGHAARIRKMRKVYKICIGKPEGNRPLGRPRHR